MSMKIAIPAGLALLLVGLLVGYVIWGRPTQTPNLGAELADLRTRLAEATKRAEDVEKRLSEVQGKFTDTEGELVRAGEALRRERERREKLEELLSKGQK